MKTFHHFKVFSGNPLHFTTSLAIVEAARFAACCSLLYFANVTSSDTFRVWHRCALAMRDLKQILDQHSIVLADLLLSLYRKVCVILTSSYLGFGTFWHVFWVQPAYLYFRPFHWYQPAWSDSARWPVSWRIALDSYGHSLHILCDSYFLYSSFLRMLLNWSS